jgi:type I restriction-modification system DNA methylase subunit
VPELARWKTLQDNAKLPIGTEITINNGKTTIYIYKITSADRLIDDALDAIEKENPKLKGVLNKTYASLQLDAAKLGDLIEEHQGKLGNISVYGQESNSTTWRLAAMNMAIRGIDFNFGKVPANSFTNEKHPDLRADYVMANPPFNMKEWWDAKLEGDPRWRYGTPPKNNANFAWMQHMIYHLAPNGSMALLLANGSMSSN